MPLLPPYFSDADQRRWFLKLLGLLLVAALLANGIFFYYAYKVRQLERQGRQLLDSAPDKKSPTRSSLRL